MLLTFKIVALAAIFVGTGGAVFTDWGKSHRRLVFLAGVVAFFGSVYLFRSMYNDIKRELLEDLYEVTGPISGGSEQGQEPTSQNPRVSVQQAPQIPSGQGRECVTFNNREICE